MIEELAQLIEASGAKADLVRAEAQKGDLLQAASYGFEQLTEQQIGKFIWDACRYGTAEPHEIHRKIVSLGSRYFVTTNYDNLIEKSLKKWQPDQSYQSVTNRDLTEMAKIVRRCANDFIFKPHGDAGDSESIILTREQYRQLLPQGERHAALESLKMLLATRPVVYFGFGLRDPDFLYVLDILNNTYKGGIPDHYAIMADISDAERDYWRRNYGIHLFSYTTTELPDKTRGHAALLTLLDSFLEKEPGLSTAVDFDPHTPDVVLALARHAAGLSRSPKLTPEFQIRVHAKPEKRGDNLFLYRTDRFDHSPVEKFLDDGPEHAVLTGLPGAGKTYALCRSAARLADKLQESCLLDSESFDAKSLVVPILADLKLYRGDLAELVSQELPKSLPLDKVTQCFKVKIFLDSFNEMPGEYWENGSYEADFATFIAKVGNSSLIISSRTKDGLEKLEFPVYGLNQIDETDVAAELQRLGIEIQGPFSREVQSLLQRPFYFQQIVRGEIKLPTEAHPRDFSRVFFENLRGAFETRFSIQLDIEIALSRVAYNALNQGEEAFLLSELLRILKTSAETLGLVDIDTSEIANWLVSASVLIPYTGGRVAFVHQSVTEYLAASELARRYQSNPHILNQKLSITRWDQALFMTLSLLPEELAETFLNDIIKADFVLALRAAKYLEVGREEVVSKLLSEIPERIQALEPLDHHIEWSVRSDLPLTDTHEAHLRTLIGLGGRVGAAGVRRLVGLKGEGVKDELLQLLVDRRGDYNLCCNGIAPALKPFATDEDANKAAAWADSIQTAPDDDKLDGFISGAAEFLSGLDLSVIRQEFVPADASKEISIVRGQILCSILQKHRSTAALDFAGELLCRGITEAATTIYFISNFAKPDDELSWDSYGPDHVRHLLSTLGTGRYFALDALKCLCVGRLDLSEAVRQEASKKSGIEKAALMYCVSPADFAPVFQALGELIEMGDEQRHEQPLQILDGLKCNWTGQEELFVQLLRLRNVQLATLLFGGSSPPTVPGLGNLNIGPIYWWLEWMMEVCASGANTWFPDQLGGLFGNHLNRDVQHKFVFEFNKPSSKFRRLLSQFVLPYLTDITTDTFSEDAISFLLATLSEEGSASHFRGHLLGRTATEEFVTERLLPLLSDIKQPFSKNLHTVLRQAGSRHGRRYFV